MENPGHADCADLLEEIQTFLDGEMDGDRSRELQAHLEACCPCASYLESARATRDALGRLRFLRACGEDDRERLRHCLDEVRLKLRP
jgi:anti-sigma factor RsiW